LVVIKIYESRIQEKPSTQNIYFKQTEEQGNVNIVAGRWGEPLAITELLVQ
jgi:hypothetical protein